MIPSGAKTVEMADHRIYFSSDNWQLIFEIRERNGRPKRVPEGRAADLVRFFAISQSSWSGDAF